MSTASPTRRMRRSSRRGLVAKSLIRRKEGRGRIGCSGKDNSASLRAICFVFGEDKIDAAADELVHRRVGRRR